jgi:predicted enzyme related to lactoylglutathione lyase
MLNEGTVTANVPAGDLKRAREFYVSTLGLTPSFEMDGVMLIFKTAGGSSFSVYETEFAGQAGHTIAQWHVPDVDREVRDLKAKGVQFEHFELPGAEWHGDVASMAGMGKAAWFKDSEGNILCVDDGQLGS